MRSFQVYTEVVSGSEGAAAVGQLTCVEGLQFSAFRSVLGDVVAQQVGLGKPHRAALAGVLHYFNAPFWPYRAL